MRIAVVGGGNGAHAAAADLAAQGHALRWWRRNAGAFEAVRTAGGLTLKDADGERRVPLAHLCAGIDEAIADAELIFLPDPAFTQDDNARRLAPHLKDGQVLFLAPGTFGAFAMHRAIRAAGNRSEFSIAETGTLPWLTRTHGPTEVAITTRATRLPTGVFPARLHDHAFGVIRRAFGSLEPVEDALSAALMNAGPIIHPPLILMNAGPLEYFERGGVVKGIDSSAPFRWDIHNEGTQPAIRRVTDALDAERIAAREALGYSAPHFPLADHYRADGEEWMYGRKVHKKLTDSNDWRERIVLSEHRYMREDVAYGLAFLVSVCNWAKVPCPVATGLLSIASAILGADLQAGPRTLQALDLARLRGVELRALLRAGE